MDLKTSPVLSYMLVRGCATQENGRRFLRLWILRKRREVDLLE